MFVEQDTDHLTEMSVEKKKRWTSIYAVSSDTSVFVNSRKVRECIIQQELNACIAIVKYNIISERLTMI